MKNKQFLEQIKVTEAMEMFHWGTDLDSREYEIFLPERIVTSIC